MQWSGGVLWKKVFKVKTKENPRVGVPSLKTLQDYEKQAQALGFPCEYRKTFKGSSFY